MINFVLCIFYHNKKEGDFCFKFEVGTEEDISETINYEEELTSKETGDLTKPLIVFCSRSKAQREWMVKRKASLPPKCWNIVRKALLS